MIRSLCASLAVILFLGGIAGLVSMGSPWFLAALFGSLIMAAPAMLGGAKPTPRDLPRIDEQLHRFRAAMLVCFGAATAVYALVLTGLHRDLASLGVAFWLVAFVLMFFVVYYRGQRRLAVSSE